MPSFKPRGRGKVDIVLTFTDVRDGLVTPELQERVVANTQDIAEKFLTCLLPSADTNEIIIEVVTGRVLRHIVDMNIEFGEEVLAAMTPQVFKIFVTEVKRPPEDVKTMLRTTADRLYYATDNARCGLCGGKLAYVESKQKVICINCPFEITTKHRKQTVKK